uniref:Putative secreted protein n=1 Tax=Ixodes ricinus TaxID=34613 RepID=A0A147BUY5_IXORI
MTMSLVTSTVFCPTGTSAFPWEASCFSSTSSCSRVRASRASATALASFLNCLPRAGLDATASTTSTVFGCARVFSATRRTPVALVCCVRS